jgi:hypothetical protein
MEEAESYTSYLACTTCTSKRTIHASCYCRNAQNNGLDPLTCTCGKTMVLLPPSDAKDGTMESARIDAEKWAKKVASISLCEAIAILMMEAIFLVSIIELRDREAIISVSMLLFAILLVIGTVIRELHTRPSYILGILMVSQIAMAMSFRPHTKIWILVQYMVAIVLCWKVLCPMRPSNDIVHHAKRAYTWLGLCIIAREGKECADLGKTISIQVAKDEMEKAKLVCGKLLRALKNDTILEQRIFAVDTDIYPDHEIIECAIKQDFFVEWKGTI